jgi:hypothetical protein
MSSAPRQCTAPRRRRRITGRVAVAQPPAGLRVAVHGFSTSAASRAVRKQEITWLGSLGRGLHQGPDGARRLGDVGEQLGQRLAQRESLPALPLGREHIVDERAAMQNALLLALEASSGISRSGSRMSSGWVREAGAGRSGLTAVGVADRLRGAPVWRGRRASPRRVHLTASDGVAAGGFRATWCSDRAASSSQATASSRSSAVLPRLSMEEGPGEAEPVPSEAPRLPEAGRALVTPTRPMRDDEGAQERRGDSRLLHCRRCGAPEYTHRSRTRGWERPIRLLSLKRTFRCHACGRRSWLGPWRERRAPAAAPRAVPSSS